MYKLNYKGTNIIAISDTHGKHRELKIPPCDILIHLGDVCNFGNKLEITDFCNWYLEQKAQTKILIAGNHDAEFGKGMSYFSSIIPDEIILLDNCKAVINCDKDGADNITIATVPVRLKGIGRDWVDLENVDILLTHCPPRGILDGRNHYGSRRLLEYVTRYKPEFHLFGHVHRNKYCSTRIGETTYVNVSEKI